MLTIYLNENNIIFHELKKNHMWPAFISYLKSMENKLLTHSKPQGDT